MGCGSTDKINKYTSRGYTFLINGTDTLRFNKIYLDDKYNHTFKIDKHIKTISYYPDNDSLSQLWNFEQIEERYQDSSKQISFLIFDGDIIGIENEYYIQRSLLENPDRIKDEVMANIRCYGRQGDVLIFNNLYLEKFIYP